MRVSVLFDAARTRRPARHRIYTVLGAVLVLAAHCLRRQAAWPSAGQFEYALWDPPFITPRLHRGDPVGAAGSTLHGAHRRSSVLSCSACVFGVGKLSDARGRSLAGGWSWSCSARYRCIMLIDLLLLRRLRSTAPTQLVPARLLGPSSWP